jgi:hypothetical protein
MMFLPDPPDDPPDDELAPSELHDRFEAATNLTLDAAERLVDSEPFEIYADEKSGGQPLMEPLDDYVRLKETPADEWRDVDDGFNEVEQAEESLDYIDRTVPQGADGDELGETGHSKQELSLMTWGVDPVPEDGFP